MFYTLTICVSVTALRLANPEDLHSSETPIIDSMAFEGGEWVIQPYRAQKLPNLARKPLRAPAKHEWIADNNYGCKTSPPVDSKFYSQVDEDVELYSALFCGKVNGTFVEIGALDGKTVSNTKFFDDHMGWSGLLIEGTPSNNEQIAANRPDPRNLIYKGGVCPDSQGSMEFGVINTKVGGTNGDPTFMDAKQQKKMTKITVECKSLTTLINNFMKKTGEDHIDFFSLDVEGAELLVLNTFDFKVPVHTWMIEMADVGGDPMAGHDPVHTAMDVKVRELLLSKGYTKDVRFPLFGSQVWRLQ